ncbi:MAG TPA: hypothetical protein VN229_24730, partial [Terriglobales bacterium]|nr:hypothetical protein [Terriglobales bacterium]
MVADSKPLPITSEGSKRSFPWMLTIAVLLSAAYAAFYLKYLDRSIGLDYLGELLPYELGQIIAGGILPPIFIWLVAGFISRRGELTRHTTQLRQRLQQLTYPAEESAERVSSISTALRQQAIDLTAATDAAHEVLASVRHAFRGQAGDLAEVAETAATQRQEIEASLVEQRKLLAEMNVLLEQQRSQLSTAAGEQVTTLEGLASSGVERIVNVLDDKRVAIERIV